MSPSTGQEQSLRAQRGGIALFGGPALFYCGALLLAYIVVTLAAPHPPFLQDYPTWVYEGSALAKLIAGHGSAHFGLKPYPVPDSVCAAGLALLCSVMPWPWAAKLWLCLCLLFSAGSWLCFLRSLEWRHGDGRSLAAWIAPSLITVNLCCWYGFIGFQIGVAVMLLFCAGLLRRRISAPAIAALLAMVFLCHAIPFLVCAIALLSFAVLKNRYTLLFAYVPSVLLGLGYVLGRFLLGGNAEETILKDVPIPYFSGTFLAYKANTWFKSLGYVNPLRGDVPVAATLAGKVGLYLLVGLCALLGGAVLILLVRAGVQGLRLQPPEASPQGQDRFLWWTVLVAGAAALLCPSRTLGISDPGARFMVCALALGILLARPRGRIGIIAAACSVLLGLAGAGLYAAVAWQPRTAVAAAKPIPSIVRQFAHVSPTARAFYYDLLASGRDTCPVFGTALLYNRDQRVSAADAGVSATSAANGLPQFPPAGRIGLAAEGSPQALRGEGKGPAGQ